ncbi:hypothetical protein MMC07_008282 [Pseudocyphellaria aurata]|nr:hypothetical protein [Pseudocyphellaria aurata]
MSTYSDNEDVLEPLMPMPSCGEHKDGKEAVPPIPLFCDRINEDRSPKSNLLLSKLPFEILEAITRYLSEPSLSALSLVSKNCCQLARSCRFSSVRFNYSLPQSHLIQKLSEEARERVANNGSTALPSIGPFFRRLRIMTDGRFVSDEYEDMAKDPDEKKQRASQTYSLFFSDYLHALGLILARALPHLVHLDICEHSILLTQSFFNILAGSSIQHLRLDRVYVDEEFEIVLPKALAHRGWPLRTLHLEIFWYLFGGKRGSTAPLCTSILKLCAPTLEQFAWVSSLNSVQNDVQSLAEKELPRLVQLRELMLRCVSISDQSTLNLLVFPQSESRLKVLETDEYSFIGQFLESCGTIRSLETFVWHAIELKPNNSFTFLRHNSQLSKLSISFPQTSAVLDEGILPMLSQSFQKLISLSLIWEGTSISTTALQLIGTLRGLQQIHLSTGCQCGWRNEWVIKHQEMRKYLKELPHLKKLAFSRDSYEGRRGFEDDYYHFKTPNFRSATLEDLSGLDELDRDKHSDIIWERQHRRRILAEADDYVRVLPRLEWMYIGKIRMGVVDTGECQGRHAVALSQEIVDQYRLLKNMFGRDTGNY